jgi:hypothetical protein
MEITKQGHCVTVMGQMFALLYFCVHPLCVCSVTGATKQLLFEAAQFMNHLLK